MIVTPCSTVSWSGESDAIVPSASNTVAWPAWSRRGADRAPREMWTRAFTIVPGRIELAEAKVRAVVRIERTLPPAETSVRAGRCRSTTPWTRAARARPSDVTREARKVRSGSLAAETETRVPAARRRLVRTVRTAPLGEATAIVWRAPSLLTTMPLKVPAPAVGTATAAAAAATGTRSARRFMSEPPYEGKGEGGSHPL